MSSGDTGRFGQVIAAVGRAVGWLALFLGCQTAVALIWMIAVAVQLGMEGDLDPLAMYDALYQRVLAGQAAMTLISGLLTMAIVVLIFLIRKKKLRKALWLNRGKAPALLSGAAVAPALYVVVSLVLAALPESLTESYTEASAGLEDASFLAFLSVVIVAPVVEEVIFRGLVMTRLARVTSPRLAAVLAAALFGACHGNWLWFCYAFVLGLIFGLLDLRAGSLLPSILGHMTFNAIGQLFTTLNILFPEGGWRTAVVTVLLAAAVLFLLLDREAVFAAFRRGAPLPPLPEVEDSGASRQRGAFGGFPAGGVTTSGGRTEYERDLWSDE